MHVLRNFRVFLGPGGMVRDSVYPGVGHTRVSTEQTQVCPANSVYITCIHEK